MVLLFFLTHLTYVNNAKKICYYNNNVTVLEAQGKRTLADDNYYCKMTSVVAFTKVTSFYRLKYVTNTC